MRKPIHIFTLAEKKALKTILYNFLGWAPESTYGPPLLNPVKINPSEEIVNLLNKVRDEGGEIHVRHLFKPFATSGYEQYDKKYIFNGLELLRILLNTNELPDYPVVFELDENDPEDLKDLVLLKRHSPPQYNKLLVQMTKTRISIRNESDKIWIVVIDEKTSDGKSRTICGAYTEFGKAIDRVNELFIEQEERFEELYEGASFESENHNNGYAELHYDSFVIDKDVIIQTIELTKDEPHFETEG